MELTELKLKMDQAHYIYDDALATLSLIHISEPTRPG